VGKWELTSGRIFLPVSSKRRNLAGALNLGTFGYMSNSGQFKKGHSGRPKGIPNKLSSSVKETVLATFQELQQDPEYNLTNWARAEPSEFYKIAAKLIPTDIKADVKTVQKITLNIVRASHQPSTSDPSPEPGIGAEGGQEV
jgi:hypothetical protein